MSNAHLIDRCRRTRAACALVAAARREAAQGLGADRPLAAALPAPARPGVVPAPETGGLALGRQIAQAGQELRRFDVRTTGLWFGTRFELRDQTLFDHQTGHTHGMALTDGVPWSEAEIARALFLTAGPTIAGQFLDASGGRPPVLLSPDASRRRARQAALALPPADRGGEPGKALAPFSGAPTGVAPIVQPFADQGHAPPFGNRSGSTSL